MTAHWGEDYEQKEGELHFENGEMEKAVRINIKQNPEKEPDENFRITLSEVSQGAKLGHTKATVVTIIGDAEFKSMVNRVMEKTHITMKKVKFFYKVSFQKTKGIDFTFLISIILFFDLLK